MRNSVGEKNKDLKKSSAYADGILEGFEYLLDHFPEVFVIGQGLWSPWYVGSTMKGLDTKYGKSRVIDTPVSEAATTGAAVGASLAGLRPIVVHPRMDFMLYAIDPIVNQAAKWSYMFAGKAHPALTVRTIINRGGEQGAQHSQALHAWFMHIPGLRVVMPYTPQDARDLLIAATLSDDPVIYIDDRWLYDEREEFEPLDHKNLPSLDNIYPRKLIDGDSLTIVSAGYSSKISLDAAIAIERNYGIKVEVFDLRVLSPLKDEIILNSVKATRGLLVVDGGWGMCGLSAEIIARVTESIDPGILKIAPQRVTLPWCPAPTSSSHEQLYYPTSDTVVEMVEKMLNLRAMENE